MSVRVHSYCQVPQRRGRRNPVGWCVAALAAAVLLFGAVPQVAAQTKALPGIIQAEDFDAGANGYAYRDTTSGNAGGQYRSTDVDI